MSEFQYHRYEDGTQSYFFETRSNFKPQANLDSFLIKVYKYYQGKGFWSATLFKGLNLLSLLWVICLVALLSSAIDYSVLLRTQQLKDAVHFNGFHPLLAICLFIFCVFWVWQVIQFIFETRDNWEIKYFYRDELRITEEDLQTMDWREIAQRIIKVPRLCIVKERMTPLDIANRIMRKENYLISMINKDVLQLSIPLPFFSGRRIMTKTLEWGIYSSIFSNVFDQDNSTINKKLLDPSRRAEIVEGLKRSFRILGCIGFIFSPFIFVFLIVYFLFQYGEEIRTHPSSFATRQWSPLARWKFRELNELPHLFEKRLNAGHPLASKYVESFPYPVVATIARFISFIVGSLVIVLLCLGVWDDDLLFQLEITDNKSALWFVGVGGSILAICRAFIPGEHTVLEPEKAMEELVQHTHYMPKSWRKKLHTTKVLAEFTQLFEYRMVLLCIEILSVLFAPVIFFFSLPNSAENIILFFEKFTVEEPGVGNVCKFAVFPLKEHGNAKYGAPATCSKNMRTRQGKMEKSFLNFKANNPEWQPTAEGDRYLSNIEHSVSQSRLAESIVSDPAPKESFLFESTMPSLNEVHQYFYNRVNQGPTSTFDDVEKSL